MGNNKKESKVKERWQNIIMYISASIEQEMDASSPEESRQINDEMYNWLMGNFTLSRKKTKETIFDLMKKSHK